MSISILSWKPLTSTTVLYEDYDSVRLDVTVLTGAPIINIQGSYDGSTFRSVDVFALSGSINKPSITTSGIYNIPEAGFLRYTISGGTARLNSFFKRSISSVLTSRTVIGAFLFNKTSTSNMVALL
jgi:hypothetical protein